MDKVTYNKILIILSFEINDDFGDFLDSARMMDNENERGLLYETFRNHHELIKEAFPMTYCHKQAAAQALLHFSEEIEEIQKDVLNLLNYL